MKWKRKLLLFWGVLVFSFITIPIAHTVNIPERPGRYVVDLAHIIDDSVESRLAGYLQELEQKTTAQMVVLTLDSLEGEPIEEFAITVAHDKWRLGRAGEDNGLLLLISVRDKKYRIEVGYGLEGALPDSFVGEVGRNYLVPYFKKGDYATGIYAASLMLANAIAEDAGVQITGMPKLTKRTRTVTGSRSKSLSSKIISLLFLLFMVYMFIKHPRTFLALLLISSMGGRRGHWGGGSGGFGGGGFGGGGGGGFGGGGATGGW